MPSVSEKSSSRRKFLLATASGVTFLAGCSQSADNPGDTANGTVVNQTFVMPTTTNYAQVNFNPFSVGAGKPGATAPLRFDPFTHYFPVSGKRDKILLKNYKIGDGKLTLEMRDDYTWWPSGDSVTAKDLETQLLLGKYLGLPIWDYANSISMENEYTLSLEIDKVNPKVISGLILGQSLEVKHSMFKSHLDDLQNASSEEDRKEIKNNLLQDHRIKDPYGYGAFKVTDVTPQRIRFERNSEYPFSDNINFSNYEGRGFADAQATYQAAISNQADGLSFRQVPPEIKKQLPSHWKEVTVPATGGSILGFSPKSEFFGGGSNVNRAARHAVAYMASSKNFAKIAATGNKWDYPQVAMSSTASERFLSGKILNSINNYGPESRPKKAASVLKNAGYTKKGSNWYRPDGKQFKTTLKYPAGWAAGIPGWRNVASYLSKFGIKTKATGVENTTFFGQVTSSHDFDLAIAGVFNANPTGYPYFGFRNTMGTSGGSGFYWTYGQSTLRVPPVGEPNGSLQEVNVDKLIAELGKTTNEKRANEIIQKLAWTHNQFMSFYRLTEKKNRHYITTDEWNYTVPVDSSKMKSHVPFLHLPKVGKMKAKTK